MPIVHKSTTGHGAERWRKWRRNRPKSNGFLQALTKKVARFSPNRLLRRGGSRQQPRPGTSGNETP